MISVHIYILNFNKIFNLEKFSLGNVFLCGVYDSDRNRDYRFDSSELPTSLMLFFWADRKLKKEKNNLSLYS